MNDATKIQLLASDPKRSVWVSASAGSGKTKVLTDRVLRLLLAGSKPHHILCITYTNNSASEMHNRINERLGSWVMMEEDRLFNEISELTDKKPSKDLLEKARCLFAMLLDDMPGIRIQTVHSFCQSVLAKFPIESGVKPGFAVMEPSFASELLSEAKRRLVQHHETSTENEFEQRLKTALSRIAMIKGESDFGEILQEIINKRSAYREMLSQGIKKAEQKIWQKAGYDEIDIREDNLLPEIYPDDECRERLIYIAEIMLKSGNDKDANKSTIIRRFADIGKLEDKKEIENLVDEYYALLFTQKNEIRKNILTSNLAKKFPECEAFLKEHAEIIASYKDRLNSLKSTELSSDLMHIASVLFAYYEALKRQQDMLDYDDLIICCHNLLCNQNMSTWVLYKLDGGISHILLDEAQDTAPMQWEILSLLCSDFFAGEGATDQERTIFVVGDEKQSIYAFQGADIAGFTKYREYFKEISSHHPAPLKQVNMNISFRSSPAILKIVDEVFKDSQATKGLSHGDESQEISHQAFHKERYGRVELWPLVEKAPVAESDDMLIDLQWHKERMDKDDPEKTLADNIAKKIQQWLDEKRVLKGSARPIRPGDIMILVQRRKEFLAHMQNALKSRNIPVAASDRMNLMEHIAAEDMKALLEFMLLPEDDLSLASLLKSPLYSIDEDELFLLCANRGAASLWQRLKSYDGADEKIIFAQEELKYLLGRSDYVSAYEILADLLYAKAGRQRFIARMGNSAGEVLKYFLDAVKDYERNNVSSMQGLLKWLIQSDIVMSSDAEQVRDEVRMMTVHGAKGLQAPVVIMPDCLRVSWGSNHDSILVDSDNLVQMIPLAKNMPSFLRREKDIANDLEHEEYNRLLYVAMTRAEEELYIAGYKGIREPNKDCWYNKIKRSMEKLDCLEENEDGALIYEDNIPTDSLPDVKTDTHNLKPFILPETLLLKPSAAPSRDERFYNPSRLDNDYASSDVNDEKAAIIFESPIKNDDKELLNPIEKGNLIHRILQIIADVKEDNRGEVIDAIIRKHVDYEMENSDLNDYCDSIRREIMSVIKNQEISDLFKQGSIAEASIAGRLDDGKIYSARIDRMAASEKEVIFADYKTGRSPERAEKIEKSQLKQMEIYAKLLGKIYPSHHIKGILIYTSDASFYVVVDNVI